jgi:large subunit ribosomal protein L35
MPATSRHPKRPTESSTNPCSGACRQTPTTRPAHDSGVQTVVFRDFFCHNAALRRPAKGLPWRRSVPERIQQKWCPVLRPDALESKERAFRAADRYPLGLKARAQLNFEHMPVNRAFGSRLPAKPESQMPKIKTKSGAKKRFKITGTGKVLAAHAGKRHGMIKRTKKQIRQLRGTNVLFKTDGDNVKKYWMPNG